MTINEAAVEIEQVLGTMGGVASAQVRPSGDDVDVIKVRVILADAKVDAEAWAKTCEAEIRKRVPGAAAFRLHVRAEADA